ncbi:DUF4133 domain-containing protein [Chryseobacterium taklimakanense]|uniref:DUF4133 domain-containing protein n=1 Tax=Chryseobacterium taklimakanense TaxID=536441 RepID=A0A3G8WHF8_9FLAO|nr:DUF4133 domain-containing protein [Chryseobacterium taklimakanense]AZI20612.1 DUF4133 domain-containing protein [Chryseobacterium taklimakanense]
MGYFLYKGLKKPLVFFGLKDKYIYYAMGALVAGLQLAAIFSYFIGLFGTLVGFALSGVAIYLIFRMQDKKGLFNKTKNHDELHIFPKLFKHYGQKKENRTGHTVHRL